MKRATKEILEHLIQRHQDLKECQPAICKAAAMITAAYKKGNKLLLCGNGGSAADAEHIVGELMKGFLLPRTLDEAMKGKLKELFPDTAEYLSQNLQGPLPAISLVSQSGLMTAFGNDQAADLVFAQQVLGYGQKEDILLAISTSGKSQNVIYAAQVAKAQGLKVISLTGADGGPLKRLSDVLINVPSQETFLVQEYHLPVYHAICACVENEIFNKEDI